MASQSAPYMCRGVDHPHPVARKLFEIAEGKRSNLIFSADMMDTNTLLKWADDIGPYIAVFMTHMEIVSDFSTRTVRGLKHLASKHNFLIFEDRKFTDIGSTVQKQYHGGALRISEWADIVSVNMSGDDGTIEALDQLLTDRVFPFRGKRALVLMAETKTSGGLAAGLSERCIQVARKRPASVIGFMSAGSLDTAEDKKNGDDVEDSEEDFVVFTTQSGDGLGQHYQKPAEALRGGSDFVTVGSEVYSANDPVGAANRLQAEGWAAYEDRIWDF